MPPLTRRQFLLETLALGTFATMGPLLLGSGCSTPPAPYFPPTGLKLAFNGPVNHLKAVSLRPGRIDLIFHAGSQLHHKWLEVSSPGVHRWGPDETSLGEPLGAYEYPAPVAVDGKIMLFAVSGNPAAVSFRVLDPATGWSDWVSLPGASVSKIVAYDTGRGTNQAVGLDETGRLVGTELSRVFTTPQPWRVIRNYSGGGQHEWIEVVKLPEGGGGVLFGRMNTGALVHAFGKSGDWDVVASAPGHPGLGVTAYHGSNWLSPIYFTNVTDSTGTETFRFVWTDANGEHYVDFGSHLRPPLVVSQTPTSDFYTEQLDLFTAAPLSSGSGRTALQWARVTTGDLINRRISWQTLASDLSSGAEQITPISWGPGRLDVFVTDSGGNVWHKWSDSRSTLGWQPSA